ncbi:unnamed protein product [Ectocarpus sp. 12 AP-2014]
MEVGRGGDLSMPRGESERSADMYPSFTLMAGLNGNGIPQTPVLRKPRPKGSWRGVAKASSMFGPMHITSAPYHTFPFPYVRLSRGYQRGESSAVKNRSTRWLDGALRPDG